MAFPIIHSEECTIKVGRRKVVYDRTLGDPLKAVILMIHGLGEHKGRYEALKEEMARHGLSSYMPDLNGHGKTEGIRGYASFPLFFQLLDSMVSLIQEKHPMTPIGLFGHSMGGLLCIRYLQENQKSFYAASVSSPLLSMADEKKRRIQQLRWLMALVPLLTVNSGLQSKDISRNPSIIRAYEEDPMVHDRISLALANDLCRNIPIAFEKVDNLQIPIMVSHGTSDQIVPIEGTLSFFEQLSQGEKTKVLYEGAFHEVFFDPEYGERMRNDIIGWFRRCL